MVSFKKILIIDSFPRWGKSALRYYTLLHELDYPGGLESEVMGPTFFILR